jgi:serine protease Do
MTSPGRSGFSRETRLLAATIAVSFVVLLVLSRFRFPATTGDPRDGSAAQPLARFAARAAFDDLSLAIRELSGRVNGSLLVVRSVVHGADDQSGRVGEQTVRYLPALRVRDDVAVVLIPPAATVDAVLGVPGPVTIVARDPVRGLTLVRVPSSSAQVLTIREGQQPLAAPGYVAVAEANAAGTSLRPIFVGRSDGVGDPRWDTPLITIGRGAAADVGAPVFTLEGRLAGLLTSAEGDPALVPAEVVMASVDRLLRGAPATVGDIGIVAQALDSRLAAATGVTSGAAVAAVRADGPAAQLIQPGDVITAVNGQSIRTPEALRLRVAREAPGRTLTLTVRRDGGFLTGSVTVRARPASEGARPSAASAPAAQVDRPLGLTLRAVPGRGSEVLRVQPGSLAELSGLRAADVIVALRATHAPAPEAITAAVAASKPGSAVFLSVERDGQLRLVALQR